MFQNHDLKTENKFDGTRVKSATQNSVILEYNQYENDSASIEKNRKKQKNFLCLKFPPFFRDGKRRQFQAVF